MRAVTRSALVSIVLALLAALTPATVSAQGMTEWSSEQRITLAFTVNADVLQVLLGVTAIPYYVREITIP